MNILITILATLPGLLMIGYIIWKYLEARGKRPQVERSDIVYREGGVSGASHRNFITRYGGASKTLTLIVTDQFLWITSPFPVSLFAAAFDVEHVIPLTSITSVEPYRAVMTDALLIKWEDTEGVSHTLHLAPRNREAFLEVIGAREPGG